MDIDYESRRMFVHYNGWPPRWDEWVAFSSDRVTPFRTRTANITTSQGGWLFSVSVSLYLTLGLSLALYLSLYLCLCCLCSAMSSASFVSCTVVVQD